MDIFNWIKVILASTVIAGFVSGIVSFVFSVYLKRVDYRNDYFKKIIEKRLNAYSLLEEHIQALKVTCMDQDQRPFPEAFNNGIVYLIQVQKSLKEAYQQNIWMSQELSELVQPLNQLFLTSLVMCQNASQLEMINFGKEHYSFFSEYRNEIEKQMAKDWAQLHMVHKFLKKKKFSNKLIKFHYPK